MPTTVDHPPEADATPFLERESENGSDGSSSQILGRGSVFDASPFRLTSSDDDTTMASPSLSLYPLSPNINSMHLIGKVVLSCALALASVGEILTTTICSK